MPETIRTKKFTLYEESPLFKVKDLNKLGRSFSTKCPMRKTTSVYY